MGRKMSIKGKEIAKEEVQQEKSGLEDLLMSPRRKGEEEEKTSAKEFSQKAKQAVNKRKEKKKRKEKRRKEKRRKDEYVLVLFCFVLFCCCFDFTNSFGSFSRKNKDRKV